MSGIIFTWIRENSVVLFSGLGTVVVGSVITFFLKTKKNSNHSTNIHSGDDSTIIKADGDVNIGSIITGTEKKKMISARKK